MDFDANKVDEYTLALLYLVTHDRQEGSGARAWKGFDWETLNRLHAKGYLASPVGQTKSVAMSEEGFCMAQELFERHFAKKSERTTVVHLPKFTPEARKRWAKIPAEIQKELLDCVWCSQCKSGTPMQLREGKMERRSLILRGTCKKCGGEVARVIEPED